MRFTTACSKAGSSSRDRTRPSASPSRSTATTASARSPPAPSTSSYATRRRPPDLTQTLYGRGRVREFRLRSGGFRNADFLSVLLILARLALGEEEGVKKQN